MDHSAKEERELIDLFDKDGTWIKKQMRGETIPKGLYSNLVCVFVINSRNEVLLTQRAYSKTWSGLWENTGGAVSHGENPRSAAKRELFEETGISCNGEDLVYLGKLLTTNRCSWMHGYFLSVNKIEKIRLQEGETINAKWVPLDFSLTLDESLAFPVRYRFIYFWQQLQSFSSVESTEPWLKWAKDLRACAQEGLEYSKDPFDLERFKRMSDLSLEILSYKTGISSGKLLGLFANEKGYQTPKIGCRTAVFHEDRVLLVQERHNKLWSLPGGWCDIGISLKENAKKECFEEAGIEVEIEKLVRIDNRSYHEEYKNVLPYEIYECYMLGSYSKTGPVDEEGIEILEEFKSNIETLDAAFFPIDKLPKLSTGRVREEAIRQCYDAYKSDKWESLLD